MATWIVLLRGINVGGKNILPMKDLVKSLETAGSTNVRTYIQSGNVVLERSKVSAKMLAEQIGETIASNHGFRPTVLVLPVDELRTAIADNPYPEAAAEPKSLHLFFLESAAAESSMESLSTLTSPSESFRVVGKVVYLHAPEGVGRSKFVSGVEKAIGVNATARNWRTVIKLLDMADKQ